MKEILANLALIFLNDYCRVFKIDNEGTHLIKNGRGYTYTLVNNKTNISIVSVLFTKHSMPIYSVYKT